MANSIIDLEKAKKAVGFTPEQSAEPKYVFGGKNYALTLGGNTINLKQDQIDWIRDRYAAEAAKSYQDTPEDYMRRIQGALPTAFEKSYSGSKLDEQLKALNLPSAKYVTKYLGDYVNWYGDGSSYSFSPKATGAIASKFKSDWEYEYTIEDQKRKAAGLMPLAIEKKYGDNRRDYELMQAGLPPEAMLTDYVGAYEKVEYETAKKNQLYDAATIKIMEAEAALGGYKQLSDADRMRIFDEVYSSSEYDDMRHLWDKSPAEASGTEPIDTLEEYDAKWSAMGKKDAKSDEPSISWSDFIGGYEKRKSKVVVNKTAYDTAIAETQKKTTASLKNKDEVRQYVDSRSADRPAEIFADMYGAGLSIGRVREAKDYLWGKATTKEEKDAIRSAFSEAANAYTSDAVEGVVGFVSDIFSAEKQAERKAAREGKRSGDAAVKDGVVKQYDQGATSTISADDAEKIFKSHLVYDEKGKPTKESIALATNMMYEAGATTPIVLEVGKRAGMKSGIFSQDYADKQKETLQDSMMGAYEAQVSGAEPVAEQKSPNDLTAFNSAFSDVVVERDLAQRKEHIDASYKANVESGNMTSADFYNAVRRAGWGDTIDVSKDAESYYKEVYAPKFEKNGEQLPKWEEIDQAAFIENFESGKDLNPDIHKTPEELTRGYLSRAFTAGIFEVISGTVGFVDMATAKMSGRTELWEFTKRANEATAASQGVSSNQSAGAQIGGLAATISEQLIRMYTVSQIGSGVLSMFSKGASALAGAASNTNAGNLLSTIISNSAAANKGAAWLVNASKQIIKSSPFITNAMGSYYSEAMANDATVEQATAYGVIGGLIEGATEAIGAELWIGRAIGSKAVAKGLIKSALKGTLKGSSITTKAVLINLVASSLGNGLEEMASYAGTWLVKRETYDKDAQFSLAEMWDNGKMGMLVGLLGAGLGMAEDTNANTIAKFLSTKKGMEWASNEGIGSIHDLFIDSVIADSQTEQLKRAVVYQDSVQSSEEHKATWNDIEAMTRQLDEGQVKFDKDIAKIDAELAKKQNAVALLTTNLEQAASDKSAAGMKKWSKIAAQLQVAQEELQVEQKQADQKRTETIKAHNESVAQQNIALEKAQARYAAHSIGMTIAFENEIKALKGVNPDMAVLGKQILSKMDAARAGKLKDYIKAYNDALTTSPTQPAGDAQTVQAPTVQEAPQNAPDAPTVANQPIQDEGNIKSEATPANPAETMGIVDPVARESVNALRQFGRAAYKRIVSGAAGTERASRVQKKLGVGGASIDASAQGIRNSRGQIQYILNDALVDINGTPMGESFMKLFEQIPQEKWGDFQKYLLAKHTEARMTLEQRGYGDDKPVLASESGAIDPDGNPTAMDANEAAALAARLESENPIFLSARDGYRSWWRNFMRSWAVDGGLMTDVQFNALDAKYPDYVPTYRVDKNSVGGASSATRNSVTVASAIRNATGSTDEIQDIRVSISDMISKYVTMERRNELVQNLYNFAELHTKAAAEFATIFDEESDWSPDVDFVSFDELANKSAAEVKDGQYIIRGFRDGEKVSMYVSKDVYDAVNYLTNPTDVSIRSKHENEILKGARAITKPIKGAITGYNPFFAVMNFARDAQTYFVNTNASAVDTFTNIGKAVAERGKNSALWQSYLALGGNASGYITSQQMTDAKVTGKGKVANVVDKAGKAIGWLGGYTENMFRFAEYINGLNKYGNTAEGRRNAMADAADVTVNFSRSGAYTKAADAFCLYLNANVQGLDKMARTIAKAPGKTALRGLSLAAIALLIRYISDNDDNPHYQNLTNYAKDSNFLIPNVFGERDENGYCTTFVKIPKSREYGALLVATIERAARFADGESFDDAFADLGKDIGSSIGIRLEPFWSAASAISNNKNYFGNDIVPTYMQGEAAPDQTTAQTSVISDAISERLYEMGTEVSPMLIDYVINQYGGFYGQLLTSATAKDSGGVGGVLANTVTDKFVADPLYQSGVVSRFYDTMDEAQHLARSSLRNREKFGISAASKDEAGYDTLGDYKKQISKLRKQEREIMASELDTPERKAKIDKIREEINRVAAEGIAAWNGR